jgi:mannosyl-3-phosphoglycerate phosphatase
MIGQLLVSRFANESCNICINGIPFLDMRQFVIFTDLDGTLMDHDTYEFQEAEAALEVLRGQSIPVIICSSKTRAEIEACRRRMGVKAPFIVENGAAIFVPRDMLNLRGENFVARGDYHVLELGAPYAVLRNTWEAIKGAEKFRMRGFSEMSVEEIGELTGLSIEEARLAAMREYSEPFVFSDTAERLKRFERLVAQRGLQVTKGGRFYHLLGESDKGKAVQVLKKLYAQTYPRTKLWAVGLGDSANDIPMLKQVDLPVLIRKKTGQWEDLQGIGPVVKSAKPGPKGWAEEVLRIVLQASQQGRGRPA